jgi:hypothetical protein
MNVNDANPASHNPTHFDEMSRLVIRRAWRDRELLEKIENFAAVPNVAARKLSDHERVNQNRIAFQRSDKRPISSTEMIHPYGRIDENHASAGRRLGIAFRPGSLPPSLASRRALSRAIRARRPS